MNVKTRAVWLLSLAIALIQCALCVRRTAATKPGGPPQKTDVKLVAEYRSAILEDMSADGKYLLLYHSDEPMQTYSISPTGGETSRRGPAGDDLRVVELETGREVKLTEVKFFPLEPRFIPGTRKVFYGEPGPPPGGGWQYKIWDPVSGKTRVCFDAPEGHLSSLAFLDGRRAVGVTSNKEGGESLTSIDLVDCARAILGPADPEYPLGRVWGGLHLSSDKRLLAYTVYAGSDLMVWDLSDNRMARKLTPDPLFFGDQLAYSPDGKFLVALGSTNPLAGGSMKNYLLFYDTRDYHRTRSLEVPEVSAITISPDSRLLAVGITDRQGDGHPAPDPSPGIAIYDLATGEKVAYVAHPVTKDQRGDPLAAKITRLIFTPDSRRLFSSTYHTFVWRIGS